MTLENDLKNGNIVARIGHDELAMINHLPAMVWEKVAERLADAFMEKHGAEVLAKIDVQVVANLAALKLGGRASVETEKYQGPKR